MLFAVAAGVHREVDVLRTESRPPMGRCARPSEAELTSHGEGIRGLHRVGEENLELAPTERRIEAGMSGEESRDGAPADEHVQHGRAGDFRRDSGDDAGEQAPEKAAPPARIVEAKQQDRVERLTRAARQQRLQIGQVDHGVSPGALSRPTPSIACSCRSGFGEGCEDRFHVTAVIG